MILSAPRDFSPRGAPTTYFWDPDVIAVDPSFNSLAQPNTSIKRLYTVFDVGADNKLSNGKRFSDFMIDGVKCGPDGIRCDVNGNVWCSSNAGRAVGYNGATVWSPEGKLLGRIRLPEICGNITFGGPKRNRLFMAASGCKSVALCGLYRHAGGTGPA